jgi:hypothetical protein
MLTVAEMLSLPPARASLGTITQDRTGLTDRYTMERDYPFVASLPPLLLRQQSLRAPPCPPPFRSNGDYGWCRARGV